MPLAVLLQILQGVTLVSSEIVPVEQLVEKLKSIFQLNPNALVNIQNLSADAIMADDDTIAMVAAWQQANGLPVTVTPAGGAAAPAGTPAATSTSAASPAAKPDLPS